MLSDSSNNPDNNNNKDSVTMIQYNKGAFGVNLLFRLYGSATYRAFIPGFCSVLIYLLVRFAYRERSTSSRLSDDLDHPYAIGVLVSGASLLIVFRANFSYSRYWEAITSIHQSLSKWMDATVHTASYHMQCSHYDAIKPPSFFDHPDLDRHYYTRDRERGLNRFDVQSLRDRQKMRSVAKSINYVMDERKRQESIVPESRSNPTEQGGDNEPEHMPGRSRLDGGWAGLFKNDHDTSDGSVGYSTFHDPRKPWIPDSAGFASTKGGRTPSLFLQELAHLSSLLSAVALSTLRNDVEGAESPLDVFVPGLPWPEVDPTYVDGLSFGFPEMMKFLTGADRSPEARTRHNAARPLSVVGGVSDNEIKHLQMARGPYAKTQLCWHWLSEFIAREHIAGSLGKVGAPIISRTMQFLGDGMINYNNARKVMWIPFPFPHAQLSVFYLIVVVVAIPFLMEQYANEPWMASILTFAAVSSLAGLHEVARELENPFRNVPNDLPLCTLQAQYNETLMVTYSGYHPDFFFLTDPPRADGSVGTTPSPMPTPTKMAETKQEASDVEPVVNGTDTTSTTTATTTLLSLHTVVGEQRTMLEQQSQEIKRLKELVERRKIK